MIKISFLNALKKMDYTSPGVSTCGDETLLFKTKTQRKIKIETCLDAVVKNVHKLRDLLHRFSL